MAVRGCVRVVEPEENLSLTDDRGTVGAEGSPVRTCQAETEGWRWGFPVVGGLIGVK